MIRPNTNLNISHKIRLSWNDCEDQTNPEVLKCVLLKVLHKIRQEKVKEFTWADIHRHLEQVSRFTLSRCRSEQCSSFSVQVLDLVPWREFSQSDFLEFVVPSDVLPQVPSRSRCWCSWYVTLCFVKHEMGERTPPPVYCLSTIFLKEIILRNADGGNLVMLLFV